MFLTLITLLGLVLRVIRMAEENRYDVDCYRYFYMAMDWARHGAEYAYSNGVSYCPPLLPYLMSLGCKLGIKPDTTALFIGIILGSSIPLFVYFTVRNLYSCQSECSADNSIFSWRNIRFNVSDISLVAAFIAAVHPSLVRISVRCLRDTLYIPFTAMAIFFAVSAIKNKSLRQWGWFAVVSSLAAFSRYEGVELVAIFTVWALFEMAISLRQAKQCKHCILSILIVLGIFFLMTLSVDYSLRGTKYESDYFCKRVASASH